MKFSRRRILVRPNGRPYWSSIAKTAAKAWRDGVLFSTGSIYGDADFRAKQKAMRSAGWRCTIICYSLEPQP